MSFSIQSVASNCGLGDIQAGHGACALGPKYIHLVPQLDDLLIDFVEVYQGPLLSQASWYPPH